jgi:hypothetical protein
MKLCFLLFIFMPVVLLAQTLTGEWTFDNTSNLLDANVGNDLVLVGSQAAVAGPEAGNGAINIGTGSYYKCTHGIPANGGGSMVNEFTLVYDFKVDSIGPWRCFFQTYYPNTFYNDGDAFINASGQVGVGATGYSPYAVTANEWYRLVVAVDLGSTYKYYLDGQLAQDGGSQSLDGRFSLYPSNPSEPLLLFADNDGEDGPIYIAYCAIYNGCFTAAQAAALGGYGHNVTPASAAMLPYLQTPSPNSMYVCWHESSADESRVEYGTSSALGSSQTGTVHTFDSSTKWHKVKLQNLLPDTEYFYQCHTGTQASVMKAFRTPPAIGTRSGHFRYIILGDSQGNYTTSAYIVNRVVEKLTELYGADWHNEVQLLCHMGDEVWWGIFLSPYQTEHFIPFSPLSGSLPVMECVGNHAFENDYYYQYKTYEEIGGTEGEKYYSFDIGSMRFIFLNPNISTGAESTWLGNKISEADANDNLDWIFTFSHMPAYSEMWPDGNSSWTQSTVVPMLETSDKAALLAHGHTHCYERGVAPTSELATLISGGSGGDLESWGAYANQTDYLNTLIAIPNYNWILVDVDLQNRSFHATTYSLGNSSLTHDNEVLDGWDYQQIPEVLAAPVALTEFAAVNNTLTMFAGQAAEFPAPLGTRFQLSAASDFSSLIKDVTRYYTDIYGDSGSPFWTPIDLNANLDLWRCQVSSGSLLSGNTYYWRIKARDPNLAWSDWSSARSFMYQIQAPAAPANLVISEAGNDIQITWENDPSILNWTVWSSDNPFAGFTVRATCSTNSCILEGDANLSPRRFYYIKANR